MLPFYFTAMLSCLDEAIKNLTETLQRSSLWNNTLIIFTTGRLCKR